MLAGFGMLQSVGNNGKLQKTGAWLQELLWQKVQSGVDEFGTFQAYLEGGYGGGTLLLWVPERAALEAFRALCGINFRGRIMLALDVSEGHQTPFAGGLSALKPARALVVMPDAGIGVCHPGAKEVEPGSWTSLDDHREALSTTVTAPTGLVYREVRVYQAWQATNPVPELPSAPGPLVGRVGWEQGVPTYGVGLVGLRLSLEALLRAWGQA